METSNTKANASSSSESKTTRRIPQKRIEARKDNLIKLGNQIAEVEKQIADENSEIAKLKESNSSEYAIRGRQEQIKVLVSNRENLIVQFERESNDLTLAISRNTKLN
ncbi:MAG: hypothetical protein LCH52_16505 [Bacteroidetes bacterium]|nr:hypothetical protein [Bacteroidota bacterium]